MTRKHNLRGRRKGSPPGGQRVLMFLIFAMILLIFAMSQDGFELPFFTPRIAEGEIWVHFIDVGQGDSVLIHSAQHAVLIDAGTVAATQRVVNMLESRGITTLDYVVATHPHSDHIGGLPGVLDRFYVRNLWMPDVSHDTATFENFLDAIERNGLGITTVQAGDVLEAGPIRMTAVAPNRSGYANLNDYSIVLHMVHGETSLLFTGDAEAISENEMLAAGWDLRSNILYVGHHGSRTSSTEAFLRAVGAQVAVISVGAGNQFGHPHPEVLERLAEQGMMVMRTDEWGTISLATDGVYFHIYD